MENPYAPPAVEDEAVEDEAVEATIDHSPKATRPARFLGALADGLIGGIGVVVPLMMAAMEGALSLDAASGETGTFDVFLRTGGFGYFALGWFLVFETVTAVLVVSRGQSIGKMLLGTRIVRTNGEPVEFVHGVLLRRIAFILVGWVPFVGRWIGIADAVAIFRRDKRCLHDHLADTIVVEA